MDNIAYCKKGHVMYQEDTMIGLERGCPWCLLLSSGLGSALLLPLTPLLLFVTFDPLDPYAHLFRF